MDNEAFRPDSLQPSDTRTGHICEVLLKHAGRGRPLDFQRVWQAAVEEEAAVHAGADAYECDSFASMRVLTSPDDPVTADNTQTFLATLARSFPNWFTYSIIGRKSCIAPVFTASPRMLEALQRVILTFYPNTAFAPYESKTDLHGFYDNIQTWRMSSPFRPVHT